jgi:phage terminase small subunit
MRGGNRQKPRATPGAKVPRPPKHLSPEEKAIWLDLAAAVEGLGTYQPSDAMFFALTVRAYAEAFSPAPMAPTARARIVQAAGSMLASWGISPLARQRVEPVRDERSPSERIAEELGL